MNFCLGEGSLRDEDTMIMKIEATNGAEVPDFDPCENDVVL